MKRKLAFFLACCVLLSSLLTGTALAAEFDDLTIVPVDGGRWAFDPSDAKLSILIFGRVICGNTTSVADTLDSMVNFLNLQGQVDLYLFDIDQPETSVSSAASRWDYVTVCSQLGSGIEYDDWMWSIARELGSDNYVTFPVVAMVDEDGDVVEAFTGYMESVELKTLVLETCPDLDASTGYSEPESGYDDSGDDDYDYSYNDTDADYENPAVSTVLDPSEENWDDVCLQCEWDVLRLTNRERYTYGLEPLSTCAEVQTAAEIRAEELISLFSHARPSGLNYSTVLFDLGSLYEICGENIAAGQWDAESVVRDWINSPGHHANMIDSEFYHLSVGYTEGGDYGTNWEQLFVGSRSCDTPWIIGVISDSWTLVQGGSLDDLNAAIVLLCSYHGRSYIPIMDEFCPDFDSSVLGEQCCVAKIYDTPVIFTVTVVAPDDSSGNNDTNTWTDNIYDEFYDIDVTWTDSWDDDTDWSYEDDPWNSWNDNWYDDSYDLWTSGNFTYQTAYYQGLFSDINEDQWYGIYGQGVVAQAVELGIMNGYANGSFVPEGNIRLSEAVKMAVTVYEIGCYGQAVTAPSTTGNWYDSYLIAALDYGIIDNNQLILEDFTAYATRAQMAQLFAAAAPGGLDERNYIPDEAIPDVSWYEDCYEAVYSLYRAGVLTGRDAYGSFDPYAYISRAEAAAIIVRVAQPAQRQIVDLFY